MVCLVGYVDIPAGVHRQASGEVEFTIVIAFASPLGEEDPCRGELLYTVVKLVSYVDVAIAVYSKSYWRVELAITAPLASPLEEEGWGRFRFGSG